MNSGKASHKENRSGRVEQTVYKPTLGFQLQSSSSLAKELRVSRDDTEKFFSEGFLGNFLV